MNETQQDLDRVQALLDHSYATAGRHLRDVITEERRITALQLAELLPPVSLLTLATVSAAGHPISAPVDGIFFRGDFYVGSAADSAKFRHITQRPSVSATYLPGEHLSVSVHGTAVFVDVNAATQQSFRQALLDIYVPRYGPEWEDILAEARYVRIDADKMFTFYMPDIDQ